MKNKIISDIASLLNVDKDLVKIEYPKDRTFGDYAIPCFQFSKELHKSPIEIANYLKENLNYESNVVNGYLNIFMNKVETTKSVISTILAEKDDYGNNSYGAGKNIVIEYSSPNVAKPFGMGHLRSTVIGQALNNISKKCGYNVTSINYLGDYGTQFGKLIYAYKKWGNEDALNESPLDELKRVYVKFHEEAEKDPSLDDEGRMWFKKLEENDEEALKYWKYFKEVSIKEFQKTYDLLNINKFDSYEGESYYKDKMDPVIDELESKNLLKISEGATIVELDGIVPALIKRSDGASLYITRDIAALLDRKKRYNFDEILYVVGNEQSLHFEQVKQIINKLGYDFSENVKHIGFGMLLLNGKKMSTRHGKSVILKDVLDESIDLAKKYILEKNPNIDNINEVSKKIGVGAVIFNDLKNYRINDIEFNLEDTLRFEGNTGPYLQYTYARINSLLSNKQNIDFTYDNIDIDENKWNLIWSLAKYEETIITAKENNDPSIIAKYLLDLAADFNKFYAHERIVDDNVNYAEFKLSLCEAVAIVIKNGLGLLNIDVIKQM
ncbi:MAG: arginine--tRNA ligase [Bacilli bacterium]|nr:arginine--tRNA ligase [Bacilli bacterium]